MNDISFEKLQQELQESAPVLRVHGRAFPVVNVPGTATKPGFTVWIRNNTEIMVILNEYEDSFVGILQSESIAGLKKLCDNRIQKGTHLDSLLFVSATDICICT